MGTSIEHRDRSAKNEKTLKCLLDASVNRSHYDWIVPIACYKAIHLVEAFCAASGEHFTSHDKRLDFVKCRAEFTTPDENGATAYESFFILTRLCQQAMSVHNGVMIKPSSEWQTYFEGALKTEIINKHLRRIESFINHYGITAVPD